MNCLFCQQSQFVPSSYEDTIFNNKTFSYKLCKNCGLVMLDPLPVLDDYIAMYPPTYQGNINPHPTGLYSGTIELIKKFATGKRLLDYGCGGGRFLKELGSTDFELYGTEFSPDLVNDLRKAFPLVSFSTIDDFWAQKDQTFDIIFMSNVLEHLTNPLEIMGKLKECLNPGGIVVAEGPLEEQINLAYLFRKYYFRIKKSVGRKASHPPFHIFRANYDNQIMFFDRSGLECLYYVCGENNWPFPSSVKEAASFSKKLQYYIAATSIKISKKRRKWGNEFLYIGRANS